jgi:hypothetical protein
VITSGKIGKFGGKFDAVAGPVRTWKQPYGEAHDAPRPAADLGWLARSLPMADLYLCWLDDKVSVPDIMPVPILPDVSVKLLYDVTGQDAVNPFERGDMPEAVFEPADCFEGGGVILLAARVADDEGCVKGTDGHNDVNRSVDPARI